MINGLIAQAAGTRIELIVSEQKRPEQSAMQEQPAAPAAPAEDIEQDARKTDTTQTGSKPSLVPYIIEMMKAADEHDTERLTEAFENGRELIAQKKTDTDIDLLSWQSMHQEYRFNGRAVEALEILRNMSADNPGRPEPLLRIADILLGADEAEEAAQLYQKAGRLATKASTKTYSLIKAARAYEKLAKFKEASSLGSGDIP